VRSTMVQELVKSAATSIPERPLDGAISRKGKARRQHLRHLTPYCVWIITFAINLTNVFTTHLSRPSLTSLVDSLLTPAMLPKIGNRLETTVRAYRLGSWRIANVRPLPCGYVRAGRSRASQRGPACHEVTTWLHETMHAVTLPSAPL
jgi:hypothetical protein